MNISGDGRERKEVQAVSSTVRRGPLSYLLSPELPERPKRKAKDSGQKSHVYFLSMRTLMSKKIALSQQLRGRALGAVFMQQ